jgi:hypothetical protein
MVIQFGGCVETGRVVGGMGVGVGGIGVAVGTAPHPTTNESTNVTPISEANNVLRFILLSVLCGHEPGCV